jgi:hypothetical protein
MRSTSHTNAAAIARLAGCSGLASHQVGKLLASSVPTLEDKQIPIKPVEDISTEFKPLLDKILLSGIIPRPFHDTEKLLRMARINLCMELVVKKIFI